MNETFREPTVDQLAMQIEEKGLPAAVAPLRADTRRLTALAGAGNALRSALADRGLSDVMWVRAYVAASTAAHHQLTAAA